MLLNSLNEVLPKCKVAHSIRQSYLYRTANVSKNYPLTYYYVQEGETISFYYNKENLIEYYIQTKHDDDYLCVIPLYNYVKNNYELILSDYGCYFKNHHEVCIVKAPNHMIYLISRGNNPIVIARANTFMLLYNFDYNFGKYATYLFHSMPIANSFVLVVMRRGKKIIMHVIDLIKEKNYVQSYSLEKIMPIILSLLEKNYRYYNKIKSDDVNELYFDQNDIKIISSINNSVPNLVFYDKCIFNISLNFDENKLENVLSIVAVYQNNELTVRLQINSNTKLENPYYSHEIDFGSSTIIASKKYKVDTKYNISQSYLYSVIMSASDYVIVNEPNIGSFVLYYKNKPQDVFTKQTFAINNFDDILFIRTPNKQIAAANRERLIKSGKLNKYYAEFIEHYDSFTSIFHTHINIVGTKSFRDLLLNSIHESNNTNWVSVDITDKVKSLPLANTLKEIIRPYSFPNDDIEFYAYMYYIDYASEDFYSLVWVTCLQKIDSKLIEAGGDRIYLLRGKIKSLLSQDIPFKLIWKLETDVSASKLFILHEISRNKLKSHSILRLISNKLNTGNIFVDLKFFKFYYNTNACYDYLYNRRSIRIPPKRSSIISILNIVRRILPIF
jgi:hypothetical protein